MSEPLPAPLVPLEVDLRGFRFMALDVVRLRDSDLASVATGEEFKAAVLLWCVAWHQVPAGSVPNDERWLARHSGAGANWPDVRTEALRGFVECSDGRLYHATVAEKAIESWNLKTAQRERTQRATEARLGRNVDRNVSRNDQRNDNRNVERNVLNTPRNDQRNESFMASLRSPIDRTLSDKDLNQCSYEGCKAIGSKSRSTTGAGPWYCPDHFEAVYYPVQTSQPKSKFDDPQPDPPAPAQDSE